MNPAPRAEQTPISTLPPRLQLELTNRCGLACASCARNHWDEAANPFGDMDRATLLALRDAFATVIEVTIGGYGDPTESPLLLEAVGLARAGGASVRVITGGAKLNTPTIDALAAAGLDRLVLSMDGATDATLRALRGVSLRAYLGWIRRAVRVGDGFAPMVQLNVVVQWPNLAELPALVQLAADEGVAGIHAFHLKEYGEGVAGRCVLDDPARARPHFEAARALGARLGVFLSLPPLDPAEVVCRQPWEHLFVRWDGSVRGCCSGLFEPADHGLVAGALRGTRAAARLDALELPALWQAPVLAQYRAAVGEGVGELPQPCRACAFRVPSLAAHRRHLTRLPVLHA